jgi:hypothetical protein
MNKTRKKSLSVGVLLILSIVVGVFSIDPIIDETCNLEMVHANADVILVRAFMQFILAIIYASIPIILYPLLSNINKRLTVGVLTFRGISVSFIFAGWLIILLLLELSETFAFSESSEAAYILTLDNMLRSARDLVNHVVMPLTLSIGNLMFYTIFYQSKLIPKWLSVWGLLATIISGIVASLLLMFGAIDIITPAYIMLASPTALFEIFLALWLLTKGFSISTNQVSMT